MSKKVCVSPEEIRNFIDKLRDVDYELDNHIFGLRIAYEDAQSRLQASIYNLEKSKSNLEYDISTLDWVYQNNQLDIEQRQAAANQIAQSQGVSPSRVDSSVLSRIKAEKSTLSTMLRNVENSLNSYKSGLENLEHNYNELKNFLSSVKNAISQISSYVYKAYDLIKDASSALTLGEGYSYYGGHIDISNIDVLSNAASRLLNFANNTKKMSFNISSSASDFCSSLDDDVSHYSRDIVCEISEQVNSLARFYRSTAEYLETAYSLLRSYLSIQID